MKIKMMILMVALALFAVTFSQAEEKKESAKPYPLKTCIVTDEALNGDHGEPYVFVQELKCAARAA